MIDGMQTRNRFQAILLVTAIATGYASAQESVKVTEVSPRVLVFATSTGNVVASVGPDGALLVGTPSAASTPEIARILASRTKSPLRYVVIFPEATARSQGDAGWAKRGAFVAMQEKALERLGGHEMGPPHPLPQSLIALGVDRPRISFDHVLAFDVNGDSIHVVHQPPAYSNADAIAHFHAAHLVYLGEVFPGDGYPEADPQQGGSLDGLVKMLEPWTSDTMHVVPARGAVATGAEVKTFRDMIVTVTDRVRKMAESGKTEEQVLAAHPTAEFDARWGHGRVSPDAFVREVYAAVKTR